MCYILRSRSLDFEHNEAGVLLIEKSVFSRSFRSTSVPMENVSVNLTEIIGGECDRFLGSFHFLFLFPTIWIIRGVPE